MSDKFCLTILGSGVMVPTKERSAASFLLEVGNKKILLDLGIGAIRRMTDLGFKINDIDLVFLSHFHTDHANDAFSLIHALWVNDAYEDHPRDHKELLFLGPKGTKDRFRLWRQIFWPEPEEYYPVTFLEGPREYNFDNIKLELFEIRHVPWFQSVGIKITYQNKILVYTGDVGSNQDPKILIDKIKNCDLLITEASNNKPTPTHFSFEQIAMLNKEAHVKRTLIVHVRPQQIDFVKEKIKNNNLFILGEDGQKIEL